MKQSAWNQRVLLRSLNTPPRYITLPAILSVVTLFDARTVGWYD